MRKPNLTLINRDTYYLPFVFVVPPTDFTIETEQPRTYVNLINVGEVSIDYLKDSTNTREVRNLIRCSWSGFFPNLNSNVYKPKLNALPPKACEDYLRKCMWDNTRFSMIIPEWLEFIDVKIERFTTHYDDHTGDIYYEIECIEDRPMFDDDYSNTIDLVTGLFKRGKGVIGG